MIRKKDLLKKNKKEILYYCSIIIILFILLLPIFILSLYSLPAADDFSNALAVRNNLQQGMSYFETAAGMTKDAWQSTSGYFTAMFLNMFCQPFLRGGLEGLRVFILAVNVFLYVSLFVLINHILKYIWEIEDTKSRMLIYTVFVAAFTNIVVNDEVLTWYCVSIAYVFVVALMFWGIAAFAKALYTEKKIYMIIASVIGLLVSGGSLNIAAMNCGIYLLLAGFGYIEKKRKWPLICFGSALAGALLNVVAPGNFSRRASISEEYNIVSAIVSAIVKTLGRFETMFSESPFILLLILSFIVAYKLLEKREIKIYLNPIIATILVFMGVAIINFPVCLGYSTGYFPNRVYWVSDCWIYIGSFFLMFVIAGWMRKKNIQINFSNEICFCLIIVCILYLSSLMGVRELNSYPTIQQWYQLANGDMKEYTHYWEDILEEIENSEEQNVIIYREQMPVNDFIVNPGLTSNSDNWINKAVARVYGKETVTFEIGE